MQQYKQSEREKEKVSVLILEMIPLTLKWPLPYEQVRIHDISCSPTLFVERQHYRRTDGWMDGRTDGRSDGLTDELGAAGRSGSVAITAISDTGMIVPLNHSLTIADSAME